MVVVVLKLNDFVVKAVAVTDVHHREMTTVLMNLTTVVTLWSLWSNCGHCGQTVVTLWSLWSNCGQCGHDHSGHLTTCGHRAECAG